MSFSTTAGELARECETNPYAMADLDTGCIAPDNGKWATLYAAPSVNPDGSIALPLVDWPSTNFRIASVGDDFILIQSMS